MNKNIKKLIAMAFVVGAFSVITPTNNLNLMTTKAYADENNKITSLKIKDSDGDTKDLYDDDDYKSSHEVDADELEPGETYYAKTSSRRIEVSVKGVDSDYIRIFNETSSDSEGDKPGDSIRLESDDTTTIIVRVYNEDPGAVEYGDDSYVSEYKLKVECTDSDDDDDEDEDTDNVYLESIYLSSGNISFNKRTNTYDVSVDEDIDEIEVRARPDCDNDEYDNYKVKINGTKVDRDDKFKDEVSLNKGKNVIEITVEDDEDNERVYTLNITRGEDTTKNNSDSNSNSSSESNNEPSNFKTNQWVQVDGKWQYKDASGNSVKNTWIQDYFVQTDGNMATGWINYEGKWYYLGSDGAKKTGWQSIGDIWYYLDMQGVMQTGWILDRNSGRYYYLNSNGSMAYNTKVDGYKIGADGAWTGR